MELIELDLQPLLDKGASALAATRTTGVVRKRSRIDSTSLGRSKATRQPRIAFDAWLAKFTGVCSTEFHVMRVRDQSTLLPAYLAVVMRTGLIVAQTKHMMTGNTHPRLANEDVVNLLIPLAEIAAQQRIVDETLARQVEATRLRAHAESLWQRAREQFAQQLLKAGAS